ncbi:hypothetical protein SCHPADRAFT_890667 [Schizopora paradoxa]|uniref:Uncharacterized protein n=1 Tax=Schizopora paradoxa TaxID=27342 RepID=A0A0H2S6Z1_9AGAM|nr:hypothetical protein SCHPADRAFT_890667 [Schizopora paradoxa]
MFVDNRRYRFPPGTTKEVIPHGPEIDKPYASRSTCSRRAGLDATMSDSANNPARPFGMTKRQNAPGYAHAFFQGCGTNNDESENNKLKLPRSPRFGGSLKRMQLVSPWVTPWHENGRSIVNLASLGSNAQCADFVPSTGKQGRSRGGSAHRHLRDARAMSEVLNASSVNELSIENVSKNNNFHDEIANLRTNDGRRRAREYSLPDVKSCFVGPAGIDTFKLSYDSYQKIK